MRTRSRWLAVTPEPPPARRERDEHDDGPSARTRADRFASGLTSLVGAGVVAIVAAALLPWIVSGETTRDSFTTVTAARRLGLLDESALQYVLLAWYAVPAVALLALVQLATGARRSGAIAAMVLAIAAIALGTAVARGPVDTAAGPAITIAAGVGTLAASVVFLAVTRSAAPTSTDRPG